MPHTLSVFFLKKKIFFIHKTKIFIIDLTIDLTFSFGFMHIKSRNINVYLNLLTNCTFLLCIVFLKYIFFFTYILYIFCRRIVYNYTDLNLYFIDMTFYSIFHFQLFNRYNLIILLWLLFSLLHCINSISVEFNVKN